MCSFEALVHCILPLLHISCYCHYTLCCVSMVQFWQCIVSPMLVHTCMICTHELFVLMMLHHHFAVSFLYLCIAVWILIVSCCNHVVVSTLLSCIHHCAHYICWNELHSCTRTVLTCTCTCILVHVPLLLANLSMLHLLTMLSWTWPYIVVFVISVAPVRTIWYHHAELKSAYSCHI